MDHSSCQQVKNDTDRSQVKKCVSGQHGRQGAEIQKDRAPGKCFPRDDVAAVVEDRARRETVLKLIKKIPLVLSHTGRPWEFSARLAEGRWKNKIRKIGDYS